MSAKSLELQNTIRLIRELDDEIEDIETAIQSMMAEIQSPITTIPGIGVRMGAMILAEIGDFSRFDSPDKILAYAGMSPATYQSGQLSLSGTYSHMEKRGSRYFRYALYNATKYACLLGIQPSTLTFPRNELRGSTTMLHSLTRQRSWFG